MRVAGRMFAPGTLVEGTVVRSVAPRMLSRAGKLYLRVDRILPCDGEPLRVVGSMSAAETDAQARFALDEEGTLHGRKPGMVNGLVDWVTRTPLERFPMILPRLPFARSARQ